MAETDPKAGEAAEQAVKSQPADRPETLGAGDIQLKNTDAKLSESPPSAQQQRAKKGEQKKPAAATDSTPKATETESKPASSPPPAPPPPIEPRDRDPFHRNVVSTEVDRETVPLEPSINLEREANRTRNEDINDLIEQVRSGEWETEQRERILRERYGRPSVVRDIKAWLSGENDLIFNPQTGTVEYRYGTEALRRMAHLGINTAETAGIMAIIGLVTGGAGIVVAPALIGSTLGRGFAEAWQGVAGKERGMREDIVIARERYYQKAQELANRISPTEPANWDQLNARERLEHITNRNSAIRSLVDFVHTSEQNGVDLIHRGRERTSIADIWRRRNEPGGQPFVDSEVFGQPVEVGDRSKGEPVGPTGLAGPSISRGSEVYQPSPDAPTAKNLDDMEKEFHKFRRKWDLIKAGCAVVGGLAGSAMGILRAKTEAVKQLTGALEAGKNVKLDIDGNWIWHNVQKVGDGMRNAWGIQDQFVFNYNNTIESLKAAVQGSQVLPGASDFGSHVLNETALRIAQAVDKQAWLEALRYTGLPAIGAIAAHFVWRKGTTEAAFKHHEKERDEMKQEEEILRRRRQPENRIEQLKNDAHKEGKIFPTEGQVWRYLFDKGVPNDPNKPARWGYIGIIKLIETPDQVFIQFRRKDPRDPDTTIEEMTADELIYGGFTQVTDPRGIFAAERTGEQQPAIETNIAGNLAPSAAGQPEPGGGPIIGIEGEEPEITGQPVEPQEAKEKGFSELEVGNIYNVRLTSIPEKNSISAMINDKKCILRFKTDLDTARFHQGDIIDVEILEKVQEPEGKNPPVIHVALGPEAKKREVNQGIDDEAPTRALTGEEEPKAEKIKGRLKLGGVYLATDFIEQERGGFRAQVQGREVWLKKITGDKSGLKNGASAEVKINHIQYGSSGQPLSLDVEIVKPVIEAKVGGEPAEIESAYYLTLKDIYEKAGERSPEEVEGLLQSVDRIIAAERVEGKDKLKGTIGEMESSKDFLDENVAYLAEGSSEIIVGDTHGDSLSVRAIIEQEDFIGQVSAGENVKLVILGDYVDRGTKDLANLEQILDLKARFPKNVILLRGNHEDPDVYSRYGFLKSVQKKYADRISEVLNSYDKVITNLPVAAVGYDRVVAIHGGVENYESLHAFNDEKNFETILWSDPSDDPGISQNEARNFAGVRFGPDVVDQFRKNTGADIIVRSHEADPTQEISDNKVITVFSTGAGGSESESGYQEVKNPTYVSVKDGKVEIKNIDYSQADSSILEAKLAKVREVSEEAPEIDKEVVESPENDEFPVIDEFTIYRPDGTPLLIKPGDVLLDSKPGDRHEVVQIRTGDEGREVYFIDGAGDAVPLSGIDTANVKIEGQER